MSGRPLDRSGLLFLCVANSSRSQMAEGFARIMAPVGTEVHSAGSSPTHVNPYALQAMKEVGIDLSSHHSKSIDEIDPTRIKTVITLCAEEICPVFPHDVVRFHWPLEDPVDPSQPEHAQLAIFRRVRDQIRTKLEMYFAVALLRPIGILRSDLRTRKEAPKQGSEGAPDAWLEIDVWAKDGLHGLQVGDRIMVITWLHRADRSVLQVHPRSDPTTPLTGVFKTRSPDRPNPLGLHVVTIRAILDERIRIGPIEAIDGTPVVDIKPVLS